MENKVYDPSKYEYAKEEDYGYKPHKFWKTTWKIVKYILLAFSIFMIYFSVIIIAIQSFNSSDSTTEFASFTFANYGKMFGKSSLNSSIMNTFLTSIIATLIATVVGTLVAVGAYYLPPKVKNRLLLLNNIPLLNADIVTGISLMLIFSIFLIFNKHIFGFWTILIAHVYFILPYIILSVHPKMKEIDPNMLDASMDLGVKPFRSVLQVIIPAIKGGIFSGLVLAFTISFEDFVVGYFTTGNGYNTLSIWIYTSIGKKSLYPGVYAFSTTVTLIMVAAVILYNVIGGRLHAKKKD
ncbi:MAG: ABC transporter permease [Acholeplasmatales bacterium]|nr:ABC transporter permease [Acholeplasmatales bacterium]